MELNKIIIIKKKMKKDPKIKNLPHKKCLKIVNKKGPKLPSLTCKCKKRAQYKL
jgi:hypothetical protein